MSSIWLKKRSGWTDGAGPARTFGYVEDVDLSVGWAR